MTRMMDPLSLLRRKGGLVSNWRCLAWLGERSCMQGMGDRGVMVMAEVVRVQGDFEKKKTGLVQFMWVGCNDIWRAQPHRHEVELVSGNSGQLTEDLTRLN